MKHIMKENDAIDGYWRIISLFFSFGKPSGGLGGGAFMGDLFPFSLNDQTSLFLSAIRRISR